MKFILYTKIGESQVQQSLGLPEYSYYFVYKEFKPVFESLGEVVAVNSEAKIRDEYIAAEQSGIECVVVFFCPPHVAPDIYPCKAFCVLAWEFDTIPDECWDNDPRNDWCYVFNRHVGLICLSSNTRAVVEGKLAGDFPVCDIPVPVWARFENAKLTDLASLESERLELEVAGSVIDSWAYEITPSVFEMKKGVDNFRLIPWDGQDIELVFNHDHMDSAYLGGFYHGEAWGTWSRLAKPWIFLESLLKGCFELSLKLRGFGASVGKKITVSIGGIDRQFVLKAEPSVYRLEFKNVQSSNLINVTGLDLTPHGYAYDQRSMAIGIEWLTIADMQESKRAVKQIVDSSVKLDIDGIIYTTVFNPADARKNWEDMVSAFCYAFKNVRHVTLILKVTHHQLTSIMGKLHFLLQQIGEVKCRVIAIHGFLPDDNFQRLINATKYYVNASSAEGLCLPMMEFMACGVPAVAPDHTAMADYLDDSAAFLLKYSKELAIWPHDPRQLKRATSFRVDWDSLVQQYKISYQCAFDDPSSYQEKSISSRENIRRVSSRKRVTERVRGFVGKALPSSEMFGVSNIHESNGQLKR